MMVKKRLSGSSQSFQTKGTLLMKLKVPFMYGRTPVTRTLKENEKQFESAGLRTWTVEETGKGTIGHV